MAEQTTEQRPLNGAQAHGSDATWAPATNDKPHASSSGSEEKPNVAQASAKPVQKQDGEKKPSKLKAAWAKLGLDP